MHRLRVGDARRPASTRRAPPRCCSSPLLPPLRPASVAPAPDAPPQPPPFPDAAFIATGSTAPTAVADDTPGTADRVAAAGTDHHADTAPKAPPAGEGEGKTPAPSASFDERPARAPGPFPALGGSLLVGARRCWGCGSPYQQPLADRGRPLRTCGLCQAAVHRCGACAAAAWSSVHKGACGAWRAVAVAREAAAVASRGWQGTDSGGGSTSPSSPSSWACRATGGIGRGPRQRQRR